MAQQVKAFGQILQFPDGMSEDDMAEAIRSNEPDLNPDYKAPKPEALDYAKGFASGANKLVSGVGYLAEAAGAKDTGKAIREFGDRGAAYWNEQMSPGGKKAAESQVFVDDPESITGLRLGDDAGKALLMGAAQSLPSMFAAALPGVAITKGIQALASLGLAGGAGATIPLLAGTAAPVGIGSQFIARVPSAIGFGAAEGVVSGGMNAAGLKSSIEGMSDKELLKSPVYQALRAQHGEEKARTMLADQAASDLFGKTAVSTGAIGALTGGGALGSAYQKVTSGAADGILMTGLKGAGQEAMQETPQSGGEKYIENITRKEYLDPSVDPMSGVIAEAASGGAIGGFTGGIVGAGSAINITKQKITPIADAPTLDDAIVAAHEAIRTEDPTLADVEALRPTQKETTNETQATIDAGQAQAAKILDIVLPDNSSVKAQWKIVDADQLAASMKEDVNQPRDRTRAASDVQIKSIANAPDYRRLSDSPVMDVGAPVVDQDGRIVAGNGRFAGLSQAYEQGTATDYMNQLREDAARKGLSIEGIAKPVLVRQLSEPVDTRKMAIASNSGTTLQMSALEQANLDAERMKGIENLDVNDLGDIALTPKNLTQLKDSLGSYAGTELGAMVDKGGQLSQEGMRRVRNAMLAKAYGSSPTLEKLVESTDTDMRNVLGALTKSANHIIKTKGDVKPLMEAVDTYSQLKATGQPVDNFLAQQDAFSEGMSKEAEGILRFIDTNVRSQKKLTDFIKGNFVETDTTSDDMFAESKVDGDNNVKQLEKHLKDAGYDFTVEPASVRDIDALDSTKKARKELAEKQAKFFKKKIVFVKSDGDFSGVVVHSIADTIFIDINTKIAFDVLTAHELSHWMEEEKPAVYREMIKALRTVIKEDAAGKYAKYRNIEGATNSELIKEIAGDLMGDNFTDQSFWQKVAEANPEAFKDIAAAIIKWLKGVIVKAKANGMGSEQWVKDATKAQDIIAKAVAQYTESEAVPVSTEGKPKLSKADKKSDIDEAKAKFSKAAVENTLIAQHNLTAKNLIHVDRMGGLAAPSIAITDKKHPLHGFGEITLLSTKDLVDPKQGAKAYGSDIYSPRYPELSYDFSGKAIKNLNAILADGVEKTGDREFYNDSLENDPFRELTHSSATMYQFLKESGKEPNLAYTKVKELPIDSLKPFADGKLDSFDMSKDEGFRKLVKDYWAEKFEGERLGDDELSNLARAYSHDVIAYRDSKKNVGKVDRQATNSLLFRQITDSGLRNKFDEYLVDVVNRAGPKERIFQGYTYSGNRRYIAHDIDNVIKILKKDLRGGENFNYGLGSIRAKHSPQFKSIEQIKKSKDRLMDSDSFELVEKEIQAELDDLNESLSPYGTFSGYDNVETMLSDTAKMGVAKALTENGFKEVPDSIKIDIGKFLVKLKDMPTEYFEVKLLRSVGLGEFSAAIIPDDSTPQVEAILKKNGIEDIRKYKSGDNEDRVKQINKVTHVMFSRAPKLYSKLEQALEAASDKVFSTGPQVKLWLQSNAGKLGIKKDEIYWSGIDNWLDAQGKVSKQQVVEFVRNNGVKVEDVTLGEKPTQDDLSRVSKERYGIPFGQLSTSDQRDLMDELDASGTKHNNDKLTLPGGSNYKELVVTVPTIEPHNADDSTHFGDTGQGKQIGWLRMDTRDGGLFIEELQSQRAQQGRSKGFGPRNVTRYEVILNGKYWGDFNTKLEADTAVKSASTAAGDFEINEVVTGRLRGVPPAPFVSDANQKATNAYITLLMKKALIEAVSNDHASVSWTTGDQQADRYDLSKQISRVNYFPDNHTLMAFDSDSAVVLNKKNVPENEIQDYIGKDAAHKLLESTPRKGTTGRLIKSLEGVELKAGGEWAQSMYGNEQGLNLQGKPSLISQAANDIFKHVGSGKVESINGQPGFYVTPEMKSKDLPLFSFAGPKAETADKYALETAQQRIAAGDPDDTVRQETGWFKGVDGKWRFEINDSDASIKKPFPAKGQRFGDVYKSVYEAKLKEGYAGIALGDILDHPKLFAAYPRLADLSIDTQKGSGASFRLSTSLSPSMIEIGEDVLMYDVLSILMHEIQHGIQRVEGFANGGSVESARRAAADIVGAKLNEINGQIIDLGKNRIILKGEEYTENVRLHKLLVEERNKLEDSLEGLKYDMAPAAKAYNRLAGEVEARNTQTRIGFNDEERRLLPPYSSQDTPDSDQIIVYNGVEMRSEPDSVVVDGIERPTTNSEGKRINNPVNFWKWFGDSEARQWPKSSRGDRAMAPPLVLYHGTKGDFNEFVVGSPGTNSTVLGPWETKRAGMFFTQDKKFAESFATQGDSTQGANILPVYLKVENAIDLTEGFTDDTIIDALAEKGVNPRLMRNISADQIWGMFDEEDDGSFFVSKLKELGYDGAIIVEPNTATDESTESWVVFDPNQIKSAIGNNGDYSKDNNDIRFSKAPSKPTPPDESRLRRFQRMNQDSFNRFTVIKEWLTENGQKLSDKADVYGAEERYHSMAANQLEDFREQQRNPLIEKIQKAGYTLGDIEVFLKMQHAQEANAQIRTLGDNPDATAYGIEDQEAADYLAEAPENLATLANEFRDITEQTKKLRLDAGILNTDITDAWEGAYKHYVPVKGEADSTRGVGKGLKTNFKSKRRLGHSLRDEHVIENILMDHERAILEVERNRVGKHLVMMAAEMQRPDILSIEQPEKRKMLKESTAYTVEANGVVQGVFKSREEAKMFKQFYAASMPKVAPSAIVINQTKDQRVIASASPMLAENEVNVYMNGHAIRVQIKDEWLARAYTKMGVEQFSDIVGAGRILNGYLSKVYTGYNPEFILTNMIRDFSSGTINLTGEQGFGMATKALTNYPRMFTDLLKYAATNGKSSTKWIDSYRANGGNTGAAYLSDMERLGNEVNTEYASYQGVLANIKQGDNANAARAAGRKVFNVTLKWIYNLNQAGENAMRLAAFKAMIDSGRTVNEAAKVAKNITVNFNRKGERQWTGALYLFYNASVQGTAATAHALTKGKHKGQAWALAGSMAAVGYMMAASFGGGDEDDWDEINDYTKERNMLIKSGDGYVKVPVPYGYGFFWNFGRHIAEAQRTGELGTMPWHLATSAISEFTPFNDVVVGGQEEFRSDQVFMGLLPTAMKIVAQPTFNKQLFSGSELMPESQFDKSQPDRQKMFRSTKGTMYDTVAGWLDSAGIDVSPETLKYITRTGTGGAGSLVDTGISAAMLKAEGAELDTQEIPFVRKAYMELGIKDKRAAYYKVREEARTAAEEFNRARRDNDVAKMQTLLKDKKELIALDRYANKLAATIDAARDQQDAVRADKNLSVQEKRLKLKDMEATEAKFYDQYLDVFKTSKR